MQGTRPRHPTGTLTPRIYAASLADYNNGTLHGRWINANQSPTNLMAEIARMLSTSEISSAEEWAIHDYEGFDTFRLSEHESITTVADLAAGLVKHGPAFARWAQQAGINNTDALAHFENHLTSDTPIQGH